VSQYKTDLLISIIMPAYNVEKYIGDSITSVINQTYSNWELIVIDDGSTDDTAAIVKSFIEKDDRIKYLYQENARQAKARNNGISHAKGSILAFLDSDDLWLPQKLEKSLAFFDLEQYDLLLTNSYLTNNELIDVVHPNYQVMDVKDCVFTGEEALKKFIEINRVPILTVLVKKEIVLKANCFDENCVPAEDFDLWIRLLKNNAVFKSISWPQSIYRIQESSSTASDRFATKPVVKVIVKNFTSIELQNLKVDWFLRKWIHRWIDNCLNPKNVNEFKKYVYHFNFKNKWIVLLFLSHKIIGYNRFKKLITKALQ
jgi:teichuronic acid biosynthesis glycosyltransferase TuaG